MVNTREVVERVGARFRFPDDAFDRLARRRSRKQRNQRVGAAAFAFVISVLALGALFRAFGTGSIPAEQPRPTPGPDRGSSKDEPRTWDFKKGVYAVQVTLTSSGCSLNAAERTIEPRSLEFLAMNQTDGWVAFDIGRIAEGHNFGELFAEIERATRAGEVLDPVVDRPRYFEGSLPGLVSHRFGGSSPTKDSSLLHVGITGSLSWSGPATGRNAGTYAVICYRETEQPSNFTPVGVAGPVDVGSS